MSSKLNLADGELNPRSGLRLKLTTQRPTDEGRFLRSASSGEVHIAQPFDPRGACRRALFEQGTVSPAEHKASGASPAVTSAFVTSVCNARLRVHDVYTHVRTQTKIAVHRRRL